MVIKEIIKEWLYEMGMSIRDSVDGYDKVRKINYIYYAAFTPEDYLVSILIYDDCHITLRFYSQDPMKLVTLNLCDPDVFTQFASNFKNHA